MKKVILGFILAVSFIACGGKPVDPSAISGKIVISKSVKSWLKIENSVMKRDEHGLGHASFMAINESSKNREFYYTIHWFDANGVIISSILSERKIVRMKPEAVQAISVPAPNDKATSYSIRITPVEE